MHAAIKFNANSEIIAALVEAGADTEARDKQGSNLLHIAAGHNSDPAVIAGAGTIRRQP